MADSAEQTIPAPRRRKWLRRVGWALVVLVALALIFHRPLFFRLTKALLIRVAKEQNLELTYDIDGTIFTTLQIENLKGVPTEPGPVERLEIGTINLRYSLIDLIRGGLPEFLETLELHDVWLVIDPSENVPKEKDPGEQDVKFPELFPEHLEITNFNLRVLKPEQPDLEIGGMDLILHPGEPGRLQIDVLDIPEVHRWENVTAGATFEDRHLVLQELDLGPDAQLERFELDASRLGENELTVAFEGELFGAPTEFEADIRDLNKSNHLPLKVDLSGLDFRRVEKFLKRDLPFSGQVEKFTVYLSGPAFRPSEWSGDIDARINEVEIGGRSYGDLAFRGTATQGTLNGRLALIFSPENELRVEFEADLPTDFEQFKNTEAHGRLVFALRDLEKVGPMVGMDLGGQLLDPVQFIWDEGALTLNGVVRSPRLEIEPVEVQDLDLALAIRWQIQHRGEESERPEQEQEPLLRRLTGTLLGRSGRLAFREFAADALAVSASTDGRTVRIGALTLEQGPNSVFATGSYELPEEGEGWAEQPVEGQFRIEAPELAAFQLPGAAGKLAGSLHAEGQVSSASGSYNGQASLTGRDLLYKGLPVELLEAQVDVTDSVARIETLRVQLSPQNRLHGSGVLSLREPRTYQGALELDLQRLAHFEPMLRELGREEALGGRLSASWSGSGGLDGGHQGTADLKLQDARYGKMEDLGAELSGTYTPKTIEIPSLTAGVGDLRAEGSLRWTEGRLTVPGLTLHQKDIRLAALEADLPLNLFQRSEGEELIPADAPLRLEATAEDLDLGRVLREFGQEPPPVLGIADLTLNASGTLNSPTAEGALTVANLRSPKAEDIRPADLKVDFVLRQARLTLDGTLRQPQVQPMTLTGTIPLDLQTLMEKKELDPATPLDLKVRLPASSLAFVRPLVPKIRAIDGTVALDLDVGGTMEEPRLDGSALLQVEYARFTEEGWPPLNDATLRLAFTRERVIIEQMRGGSAGGAFSGSGTIEFTTFKNPTFDVRLQTRELLVKQTDNLTVRANSRLALTGPLDGAALRGEVGLTHSRFFKDIDILPIGLPGRPAPKAPPAPADQGVSLGGPLANWDFGVRIRTADPFLIQGNLADGRAVADLYFGGKGEEPYLEGTVLFDDLVTSLPFSRLRVTNGRIYYTRELPFEPQLDIRATSEVRDYDIDVYIYGTKSNPQATFTSQPPLTQADIVSLLATGTTREELSDNPNVLAGRAAVLLFKKYWHKWFGEDDPLESFNQLPGGAQLEFGAVDPKTGRERLGARVPLTEHWVLSGGVDVGGDFRGQIKYVLRFR